MKGGQVQVMSHDHQMCSRVQKMLMGEAESLGAGEEKPPGLAGFIRNLEVDPSHRRALVSDSGVFGGHARSNVKHLCSQSSVSARG